MTKQEKIDTINIVSLSCIIMFCGVIRENVILVTTYFLITAPIVFIWHFVIRNLILGKIRREK